jgi:hypothetical protein
VTYFFLQVRVLLVQEPTCMHNIHVCISAVLLPRPPPPLLLLLPALLLLAALPFMLLSPTLALLKLLARA